MKNILLVTGFLIFMVSNCFCQEINLEKSFGGLKYYQGDEKVCFKDLGGIMKDNKEASFYYTKAKSNKTLGDITSFVGGFLVGYSLGSAIGSNEGPSLTLIGVGAGFIVISIPLHSTAKKNTIKAVDVYNRDYTFYQSKNEEAEFVLNFNASKFGMTISF